jgi:hypothetical protein
VECIPGLKFTIFNEIHSHLVSEDGVKGTPRSAETTGYISLGNITIPYTHLISSIAPTLQTPLNAYMISGGAEFSVTFLN